MANRLPQARQPRDNQTPTGESDEVPMNVPVPRLSQPAHGPHFAGAAAIAVPEVRRARARRLGFAWLLVALGFFATSLDARAAPKRKRVYSDKPRLAAGAGAAAVGASWLALHGAPSEAANLAPPGTAASAPPVAKNRYARGEYTGVVTYVTDGDTVWVAMPAGSTPVKLRLEGIDAPEICQEGGAQAREALAHRVLGRAVLVKVRGVDTYGRRIGTLYDETEDIGQRMVKDGQAWSLRYRWERGPYIPEERMAKSLGRGVHAKADSMLPSEFRKQHGSCKADAAPR